MNLSKLYLTYILQTFFSKNAQRIIKLNIQQTREIAATLQGGQVNHGII